MSWGTELWDQFDNIASHTQKGIEFCEKYSHFIKERCQIENEYASKLKRLAKNYKPKKADNEELTCAKGFYRMLNEIHDLAGQHESIAECLDASILRELQTLISEVKSDRKKHLQDGSKQQNLLKNQLDQLEKSKKQYEKSFKESEKMQENYKKADADIHLSRADLEKAKNLMISKQQTCEQCKSDYAAELQKANSVQKDHYETNMPNIFSQLQSMEEKRVNTVQEFIKECAEIERRTMPIVNTCIDGMVGAANSINATEDSKVVIERYKSGFAPPGDLPFEDLSSPNGGEHINHSGGTPKQPRQDKSTMGKGKKQRSGFIGLFANSKTDEAKEDYSHLPPNQQKKKLNEKIDHFRQLIATETAQRDGMIKMRDVYSQNRNLGDPASIDKQLEQNAQKLDGYRRELQKYEGFLSEATEPRGLQPNSAQSSSDSLSKRTSSASLSSSSNRSSNPGTPQQQHQSPPQDIPQRQISDNVDADGSFEDITDEPEEFDFPVVATCLALYDFEAPNEGSIAMKAGEEFSVLERDQGDGWTRVKRSGGEVGFVPTSYIRITEL